LHHFHNRYVDASSSCVTESFSTIL
jgi:hypothetical protein